LYFEIHEEQEIKRVFLVMTQSASFLILRKHNQQL